MAACRGLSWRHHPPLHKDIRFRRLLFQEGFHRKASSLKRHAIQNKSHHRRSEELLGLPHTSYTVICFVNNQGHNQDVEVLNAVTQPVRVQRQNGHLPVRVIWRTGILAK